MKVTMCDRCGAKTNGLGARLESRRGRKVSPGDGIIEDFTIIDLCRECTYQLEEFLERGKPECLQE